MTRPFRVALLQLRAHDLAAHRQAWEELLRRLDQALAEEPDLVVLPAASYPAGVIASREAWDAAGTKPDSEVLETLGQRAKQAGCAIAGGLVLRGYGGAPRHAAVLVSRSGLVSARATESAPVPWFSPGDGPVPVAASSDPALLVAGSDIRDPGLAARAGETGARLIIHCGAPTSWGADPEQPVPSHAETLLAARAAECGAWLLTTGKVGIEAESILYEGGAGIVDPAGRWLIRAPADSPGVVLHDIDLDEAPGPPIDVRTDLLRATDGATTANGSGLLRTVAVAGIAVDPLPSAVDLMEHLRRLVRTAVLHGARVVVLPDLAGTDARAITQLETLPLLENLSRETGAVIIVGLTERADGGTFKTVYAIDAGAVAGSYRQLHLVSAERDAGFQAGDAPPRPVETAAGRIGLIGGADGLSPGVAAVLRRTGASMLTWCAGSGDLPVEALARTRASETELPGIVAASTRPEAGAALVDARGGVTARTPAGQTMVAHGIMRVTG